MDRARPPGAASCDGVTAKETPLEAENEAVNLFVADMNDLVLQVFVYARQLKSYRRKAADDSACQDDVVVEELALADPVKGNH